MSWSFCTKGMFWKRQLSKRSIRLVGHAFCQSKLQNYTIFSPSKSCCASEGMTAMTVAPCDVPLQLRLSPTTGSWVIHHCRAIYCLSPADTHWAWLFYGRSSFAWRRGSSCAGAWLRRAADPCSAPGPGSSVNTSLSVGAASRGSKSCQTIWNC